MICFTERKNKQVQHNTEQSYSLMDDTLYINNRCRLKNLDVNSNVFRARRWNIELCMQQSWQKDCKQLVFIHSRHQHLILEPRLAVFASKPKYVFIAYAVLCCFAANRIWNWCTTMGVDTLLLTDAPCKTRWDQTAKQPKERSVCKVCLEHHIQLTPACAIEEKLMIRGKLIPDDHSDQNSWT